ncbi:hypothetical protein B296_00009719 [Ensete ventricosum]|uniref:Uncharacterized protein n=1 Tax=Ensete ventricosum TaxID=4639 RepID=A0A427AFD0_ENSVE|nr:hypothetical protein B296_00009719 [Ensete ventricosum]
MHERTPELDQVRGIKHDAAGLKGCDGRSHQTLPPRVFSAPTCQMAVDRCLKICVSSWLGWSTLSPRYHRVTCHLHLAGDSKLDPTPDWLHRRTSHLSFTLYRIGSHRIGDEGVFNSPSHRPKSRRNLGGTAQGLFRRRSANGRTYITCLVLWDHHTPTAFVTSPPTLKTTPSHSLAYDSVPVVYLEP